jgi:hypothetical protein
MELAFAGLHRLCASLLDGLSGLQRDALRVAFGFHGGDAPDRFLALRLLANVAEYQPLVCLVDRARDTSARDGRHKASTIGVG